MEKINFIEGESYDGMSREIYFHAQLAENDKLVRCRVPSEILREYFGASDSGKNSLIKTFCTKRAAFEKIAQALIQTKRFELDDTILIGRQDI